MSKTALLAQNDNLAIESLKQKVGRSVFDLSHSITFPIDVDGAILPICCIETVPSDSFEISCEALLRQLTPLVVPLMTNLRLNTAWYWCDNRLAWKKWDRFMTGGRSGNETYDIPRVANIQRGQSDNPVKSAIVNRSHTTTGNSSINIKVSNTLHTYFGISTNYEFSSLPSYSDFVDQSEELPVAFPFFDYQLICRDFYTDPDRLKQDPTTQSSKFTDFGDPFSDWAYSNLFPPDDDEIRLKDGIQIYSGFQSGDDSVEITHGFVLDKIRYHNVREDYFTTSKKAPMRGDVPEIETGSKTLSIDFTKAVADSVIHNSNNIKMLGYDISSAKIGSIIHPEDMGQNTQGSVKYTRGSSGNADLGQFEIDVGSGVYEGVDLKGSAALIEALNKAEISQSDIIKVNAAELRLLSQLTVWQELNMLHKPYYNDFLNAHFEGVKVGESTVEKPQFIGGTSQLININSIEQVSASTESSPLGRQGAFAQSLATNYVGKYYCNNYGYLIGVAYIIPDLVYEPAMPRGFSRRTKEDYYSPEFANLSMQATLNKEIFFSNDDEWNNTPWGYTGCFDELRSIPNRIAGDLLNSSYSDLQAWVLRRNMANDNKPSMSSEWLSLKGNVNKNAWSNTTMPAFMLQCANFIKAVRPLPYVAIPKAL